MVAAAGRARRELHLATLFSRTYTHTHRRSTAATTTAKGLGPRTRCSRTVGCIHTPGSNATARSRRTARYLHHNTDFFLSAASSPISLRPSRRPLPLAPLRPRSASLPLARALARSHSSFRSRPCVRVSRARRTPLFLRRRYAR